MRYLCTIYTNESTLTSQGFVGTEPNFEAPIVDAVVEGATPREAAARAYVHYIGRKRAKRLRRVAAPAQVIAQETSRKAIAASLRKTNSRMGEGYTMDNLADAWFIKVEQVATEVTTAVDQPAGNNLVGPASANLRRLRLSHSVLWHLTRTSSPN